ncbi:hypothetical protein EYF80_034837 [Liparis tanakae]|uniref:Uncharacterized protein n=1 Tax=Liparis tanakae TaxID=230148 RepID=A0A4Z2GNP2_9TELE|nr:hypothetical protein EYF80_034837 [Liparis tanakae]
MVFLLEEVHTCTNSCSSLLTSSRPPMSCQGGLRAESSQIRPHVSVGLIGYLQTGGSLDPGNRGGHREDDDRQLPVRMTSGCQWICCVVQPAEQTAEAGATDPVSVAVTLEEVGSPHPEHHPHPVSPLCTQSPGPSLTLLLRLFQHHFPGQQLQRRSDDFIAQRHAICGTAGHEQGSASLQV